ncbi:MAG: hypothetical protein ABI794_13815 [Betaproteobacteria bacterium]
MPHLESAASDAKLNLLSNQVVGHQAIVPLELDAAVQTRDPGALELGILEGRGCHSRECRTLDEQAPQSSRA